MGGLGKGNNAFTIESLRGIYLIMPSYFVMIMMSMVFLFNIIHKLII